MASRLDRLVLLLDTGSTKLIRSTAAQQLADIQKKHPQELYNLLTRVTPFLRSKSWDTRIATAEAIGGIVKNQAKFNPNDTDSLSDAQVKNEPIPDGLDQLNLATLDLEAIITNGKQLLGSAGREYDYFINAMEPTQRLAHQKKSLTARLGLGGEYIEEDLIAEADILKSAPPQTNLQASSPDASTPQNGDDGGAAGGLSKRQLNMLKRKNKKELKGQASKVQALDLGQKRPAMSESRSHELPSRSNIKSEDDDGLDMNMHGLSDSFNLDRSANGDDNTKMVSTFKGEEAPEKPELQTEGAEQGREWPFELLSDYLMVDLFDHSWEVRHGAAAALREIMMVHGAGAGRERGRTQEQNDLLNQRWLDDLAARCLAVFMLDRFGDYVSDKVTAPVREAVGQVFGALLQFLSADNVRYAFHILARLVRQDGLVTKGRLWQACHGGMIGLRYLVAVRTDLLLSDPKLMDGVLDCVLHGLEDGDDDVRVVSADTLIPVSKEIVDLRPNVLDRLVSIIWSSLASLSDDLSSSTGSIMDLLAKLCTFPQVLDIMKRNASMDAEQSFGALVPRLYPFLRHAITGVRSAVLRALQRFASMEGEGGVHWIDGKALRLIFQNILVERNENVLRLSLELWNTMVEVIVAQSPSVLVREVEPHLQAVVSLTLHPFGIERNHIPMNASFFIRPSGQVYVLPSYSQPPRSPNGSSANDNAAKKRKRTSKPEGEVAPSSSIHNIDNPMICGDIDLVTTQVMARSKIFAARALGKLIAAWPQGARVTVFGQSLKDGFKAPHSSTRLTTAMVCEEFAKSAAVFDDFSKLLTPNLQSLVDTDTTTYYTDIVNFLRVAQQQCKVLQNKIISECGLKSSRVFDVAPKVQGEDETCGPMAFSLERAEQIRDVECDKAIQAMSTIQRKIAETSLVSARKDVEKAVAEARDVKAQRDVRIKSAAAAALVAFKAVPLKKPSSTIKGIMDSVKTEENMELQTRSAAAVVSLIQLLVANGRAVPTQRLVGNIVKFYCGDSSETPVFSFNSSRTTEILSVRKDETVEAHQDQSKFEREAKEARITRRGAKDALERLCAVFGSQLFDQVPTVKNLLIEPLSAVFEKELPVGIEGTDDNGLGQQAIDAMSMLKAIISNLDPKLHSIVFELVPLITKALRSRLSVFRYIAAKSFATLCSVMPVQGFTVLVKDVLPSFEEAEEIFPRQGAIECIYHLINAMGDQILPYVIFLISPVLGRMSDSDPDTRQIATVSFATLIKLVPLEAGIPDPPGMSDDMLQGRETERQFIAQMLDPKSIQGFSLPVEIKATLRSYQQDGVNWLAFLNRYNLHGILCDDMGLGKTLQTICIVASDHHNRAEEYRKTQKREKRALPSLIVCPPTLSGHWKQELNNYAPFLKVCAFVGPPSERAKRRAEIADADIVITSYEVCRNETRYRDDDPLRTQAWNYCVLDEGHLIKNHESKISIAVKSLNAYHRLILSGTPIQNNVLELWSLFDFLMPGFLGTREIFNMRFVKPIAASRNAKSDSKAQEAGALALEALHKQVQPFLLRRLKEEVLDDLPPKILQNYYCDLSELQKRLYEDFTKKEVKSLHEMANTDSKETKQHIFTALNYMRRLCNSPALVMKETHKGWPATQEFLKKKNSQLRDPVHAPKLAALRSLLIDCGIGAGDSSHDDEGSGRKGHTKAQDQAAIANDSGAVSQHRALIFCQMKEMLDIVQDDLLKALMPSVTYLRLDGSVEATQRQSIVNKFNGDPSIDCLLLTTSVGGLGLNLTGADTVIFVEHDWNPQKDIQAMDRAHRIGQKKTVNVYRLITRGTLEEKILNLQRFKIDVASSVVKQQKAPGLAGMQTGEILDLFNLDDNVGMGSLEGGKDNDVGENGENALDYEGKLVDGSAGKDKGKKGFLDDLGELWDERQYEEEYNLDDFLSRMKG